MSRDQLTPEERMGLPKGANSKLMRRLLRDRALALHPDAGGDEEAFKEISSLILEKKENEKFFEPTRTIRVKDPMVIERIMAGEKVHLEPSVDFDEVLPETRRLPAPEDTK